MWGNIVDAGQATDDNMAHVHRMLDTEVYQHTLRLCNTAFPLQQWLPEPAPLLRLYVHCLSCYNIVSICIQYFRI